MRIQRLDGERRGIGMTSQRTRDRLVARLRETGVEHPRVLEAIRSTPRHCYVDEALASRAYEDTALPIGYGQTISRPAVVARMTEAVISEEPCARVLEVGTGSGYQAAVLAAVVREVYTVERIEELARQARRRFREQGLHRVKLRHGDGSEGWPNYAPYDAIVAACAPQRLPPALIEQLAEGGRLVLPLGGASEQRLEVVTKTAQGLRRQTLGSASFVPLVSGPA